MLLLLSLLHIVVLRPSTLDLCLGLSREETLLKNLSLLNLIGYWEVSSLDFSCLLRFGVHDVTVILRPLHVEKLGHVAHLVRRNTRHPWSSSLDNFLCTLQNRDHRSLPLQSNSMWLLLPHMLALLNSLFESASRNLRS